MGIFDFFKRNKIPPKTGVDQTPSPEQAAFADNILLIIKPALEEFGFKKIITEVKTYSATITFRKHDQYIIVASSSYPTDYPYCYNIVLGDGNSEDFFEYDWNSIALWQLAIVDEQGSKLSPYALPVGNSEFSEVIKPSIETAKSDLLKYGLNFLQGDLTSFYQQRKKINEAREPYRITQVGKYGVRHTTYDPRSIKQKKRFS